MTRSQATCPSPELGWLSPAGHRLPGSCSTQLAGWRGEQREKEGGKKRGKTRKEDERETAGKVIGNQQVT